MKHGLFGTKQVPNPPESTFFLAGKNFPLQHLDKHILIIGQTGSGKSVTLRLLLEKPLKEIGKHAAEGGYRAVLYDPKAEMLPQLAGAGITCPLHINNPFDVRSSAWKMCEDITSPAAALQTACILIPEEETMQPFFNSAVRIMLYGTMVACFQCAPGAWTLRHCCLIMRSTEYLKQLLSQTPFTRYIIPLILKEEGKMLQSIMATVATKMLHYEIVAALWHRAEEEGRVFSLRDFLAREEILLLGNYEEAREATDAIHRALFQRLTGLLLSQTVSTTRRTFIVFDELREAGELPGLHSLLLRGRAYGVCGALSTQSKSGVDAVYTREVADELLDQCGFRLFLKCEGETAVWASRQFGEQESIALRANESVSYGGERTTLSQGRSEEFRKRDTVMAGELMSLPPASAREGVHGFAKTPWGAFRAHVDFTPLLPPEDANTPGFVRRPEEDEFLEGFTEAELAQFGLIRIPEPETDEAINWQQLRRNLYPRNKRRRGHREEKDTE